MARPRQNKVLASIAGFSAILALTGCGPAYPEIPRFAETGGQTQAELNATLASIPGVTFEEASGGAPNGKGNTGYVYRMTAEPGYAIGDGEALITYLVKSAWSIRDGYMPNTTIEIDLLNSPDDDPYLKALAQDAGWVPPEPKEQRRGLNTVSVWVDNQGSRAEQQGGVANRKRLGDWPGPVPQLPGNLFVRTSEQTE